jgi:phytoene dehydrogenase-like protein
VDKILTRNGTAVGVRCEDTEYEADYVISASDYKQTFLKLLDKSEIPEKLYDKIKNTNVSEGIFVVYLGLNISNEDLKRILKSSYVGYKDISTDVDVQNPNDARYFEKASFSMYSLSLENPELAPDGKSSLMIFTMTPYKWLNNWSAGDRQAYRTLKEQVRDTLVERASVVIPNLEDLIEYQDAATPLTFERFTHNTDGATSAWSWNPHKKFYKRTFSTNVKTPVKNLLIGSCWATQMGGIPGALGAAYACVERIQ